MIKKKKSEHGESGRSPSQRTRKRDEATEHLNRFWQLLPDADPDKIIKPLTILQESVVYQECFSSILDEPDGDSDDFFYEFDEMDTFLIQ